MKIKSQNSSFDPRPVLYKISTSGKEPSDWNAQDLPKAKILCNDCDNDVFGKNWDKPVCNLWKKWQKDIDPFAMSLEESKVCHQWILSVI